MKLTVYYQQQVGGKPPTGRAPRTQDEAELGDLLSKELDGVFDEMAR